MHPAFWLDGGDPSSEMAQKAQDGDLQCQLLIVMLGGVGTLLLVNSRDRLRLNGVILSL